MVKSDHSRSHSLLARVEQPNILLEVLEFARVFLKREDLFYSSGSQKLLIYCTTEKLFNFDFSLLWLDEFIEQMKNFIDFDHSILDKGDKEAPKLKDWRSWFWSDEDYWSLKFSHMKIIHHSFIEIIKILENKCEMIESIRSAK